MAAPVPLISAETWSRWWNRVSQVSGLGLIVFEALHEKPSGLVMLFGAAMMLGAAGLRLLVRGAISFATDAAQGHDGGGGPDE